MDEFANLSSGEKQPYFEKAAASKGLAPEIIEKDFWVCWVLKSLFSDGEISNELLFKGGTSLSKVFSIIERFSEDIDITINRSYLGFMGDKSPENATSNKQRKYILEGLSSTCREFVQRDLKGILENYVVNKLPDLSSQCSIDIDTNDPDKQTLLFRYPTELSFTSNSYIYPYIKIELGARGGDWPVLTRRIKPMLEEEIPNTLSADDIAIRVLDVKRTFWEKAVILHKYAHFPKNKTIPERQSRHYFDFYKLLNSDICEDARGDRELLHKVVKHYKIVIYEFSKILGPQCRISHRVFLRIPY